MLETVTVYQIKLLDDQNRSFRYAKWIKSKLYIPFMFGGVNEQFNTMSYGPNSIRCILNAYNQLFKRNLEHHLAVEGGLIHD